MSLFSCSQCKFGCKLKSEKLTDSFHNFDNEKKSNVANE